MPTTKKNLERCKPHLIWIRHNLERNAKIQGQIQKNSNVDIKKITKVHRKRFKRLSIKGLKKKRIKIKKENEHRDRKNDFVSVQDLHKTTSFFSPEAKK